MFISDKDVTLASRSCMARKRLPALQLLQQKTSIKTANCCAALLLCSYCCAAIDSQAKVVAKSSSGSLTEAQNAVSKAVSEAVANACQGDITAVAQALAVAVANASATAWAKAKVKAEVTGTGQACGWAKASAVAGGCCAAVGVLQAYVCLLSGSSSSKVVCMAVLALLHTCQMCLLVSSLTYKTLDSSSSVPAHDSPTRALCGPLHATAGQQHALSAS